MIDFEKLRELERAATPGPWEADDFGSYVFAAPISEGFMICQIRGWGHLTGKGSSALGLSDAEGQAIQRANQQLICAAHNALPELLEEAEAANALRVELTTLAMRCKSLEAESARLKAEQDETQNMLNDAYQKEYQIRGEIIALQAERDALEKRWQDTHDAYTDAAVDWFRACKDRDAAVAAGGGIKHGEGTRHERLAAPHSAGNFRI